MAYTKQNFKPEQVLTAAELNAMDEQIRLNDDKLRNIESSKQDKLIDGSNIKTINGESILGSGNITISGGNVDTSNLATKSELNAKQDKLVSGTNIKTVNGQSIVGSGNITITGGDGTVEKTTEEEITAMGFTKNKGTVTAVKINGDTKNPSNGVVDLGYISGGEGGKDGIGKFKSTVFTRSTVQPDTPEGGNWRNPIPDGWSDGIPSEDENNQGRVWSSYKIFYSDDSQTDEWSEPTVVMDTVDFEAVYSEDKIYTEPTLFYRDDDGMGITKWYAENPTWTDDGTTDSIWMATTTRKNGAWSNWTITRIKGEKGDQGINAEPTLVAYLDNPMDSVLLDANGAVTAGLPCTTNFYVYKGTEKAKITNIACEILTPGETEVVYTTTISDDNTYSTLNVESLGATQNSKVSFKLTGTTEVTNSDGQPEEKSFDAIFLINKISASSPNIMVDLGNDNINVPCDADKNLLDSVFPLSNDINAYKGTEKLTVNNISSKGTGISIKHTRGEETFTIEALPTFDDVLTVNLDIKLTDKDGNNIDRTASFRIIKVVPGAQGQPAEFYEINTSNKVIKVTSDNTIVNKELEASVIHFIGDKRSIIDSSNLATANLKLVYAVDEDADQSSTNVISNGVIDLTDALNALNLDSYISIALIKDNTTIIDSERIYMVHDGTPATMYRLISSDNTIRKSNTGDIKNTENIVISIYKVDGEELKEISIADILANESEYSITKSIDGATETKIKISNEEDLTITTNTMNNISKTVTYKLYYDRVGTDTDRILIDSVTISVVQDGANGVDGKMMYFDGEFATTKTYVPTEKALPYVYDDSGIKVYNDKTAAKYFYLRADSYGQSETTPYKNYMDNKEDNRHSWEPIESMDVLYSKIGLFETANVGPAVFYGDYVFSQTSIDGGNNFNDFDSDPINGVFKPAVWFNFKTGQGSLARGNISWDENGEVTFGSGAKLEWKSEWDQEATRVTQDTISTYKITAQNIDGGKINADWIDVENLTVDKLDTNENSNNDKIRISGNKISVYGVDSNEDSPCVLLSNDTIGNISTSDLTNDSLDVDDLKIAQKIDWTTTSINGTYNVKNDTTIIRPLIYNDIDNGYFNIGIINAGGTITFNNQVFLLKSTSYSIFNYDNIIKPNSKWGGYTDKWSIDDSTIKDYQYTPSLQIIIEKLNNNKWEPVINASTSASDNSQKIIWDTVQEKIPNVSSDPNGLNSISDFSCYSGKFKFDVEARGIYRAQVQFIPATIQTKSLNVCNTAKTMTFASTYEVTRNFTGTNFTEIGKNGMVVKSNNNVFVIDDNEVAMTNESYGIKLNTTGVYAWDSDLSAWKKLDFSKIYATEE